MAFNRGPLLKTVSLAIVASALAAGTSAWAEPCKVVAVGQTGKHTPAGLVLSVGVPAGAGASGNVTVSAARPENSQMGNVAVSAARPESSQMGNVAVSAARPENSQMGNVAVSAARPESYSMGNVAVSGARPGTAAQPSIFVRVAGDAACELNVVVLPSKKK